MTDVTKTQATHDPPPADEAEGTWTVTKGKASTSGMPAEPFTADGIEPATYNNPFAQGIERVWYDGKIVFALDVGELDMPEAGSVGVAKEYQPVYRVELDERGKLEHKDEVPGQLNIYDSVPGQDAYSPIWQFYYVEVPRAYRPNSLRSAADCERSGYRIVKSNVFEN